jgi:D-3-phosphoglycerate dehydrogenase / 2-oxoglutarate reductase
MGLDEKVVLILTQKPFDPNVRDKMISGMESAGLSVRVLERYMGAGVLSENLAGVHGLIVRSDVVDHKVLDAAHDLELVVRAGSGTEKIDGEYAETRNIQVQNTPGQNSNSVAELALGMMISLARNVYSGYDALRANKFLSRKGKKLGIHGFGHIGQLVARKASTLGMEVIAYDITPIDKSVAKENGATIASAPEEIYRDADFVSLHVPSLQSTRASISYKLLSLMGNQGILINTARPDLVHTEDLIRLMHERPGFKYGFDAEHSDQFNISPLSLMSDRVLVTPKIGAQTADANRNAGIQAANQVIDFLVHGRSYNQINNPLPGEMVDYAILAEHLGRIGNFFIPNARSVELVFYGTSLSQYGKQLSGYAIKGLLEQRLGNDLSPGKALEIADEHQLKLTLRNPDPRKIDGNSIEIVYFADDGTSNLVSGRLDRGRSEVTQIGEFPTSIPIEPLEWVVVQYHEVPGMADRIGRKLTENGYNKVNGGFRQNQSGDQAMTFFQVKPNGNVKKPVDIVVQEGIKRIPGVINATYVDMRP